MKVTIAKRLLLAVFCNLVFLAGNSQAEISFCGSLDFTKIENNDLVSIVYLQNLSEGRDPNRSMRCGLPGERLPICSACENDFPESALSIVRPILGEKSHVDWHAKWHKIRTNQTKIHAELYAKLQARGLVPQNLERDEFFEVYGFGGRLAGESFFYMHRMMIKMLQFELSMRGLPCVAPWTKLPESIDDAIWPVPRGDTEEARGTMADELESLKRELRELKNAGFLRSKTLNGLGTFIEPKFHQKLHRFYRSYPYCSEEGQSQGFCDDLVPVETSPLNKYFWKIHGLVDEILGLWLEANGYTSIKRECGADPACFQWEGIWVGKVPLEE